MNPPHIFRGCNSLMLSPAAFDAFGDAGPVRANLCGPISKAKGFFSYRNKTIAALVSVLIMLACPSAIFWTVVAGIVNALESQPFRHWAHVIEKGFKFQPLRTHLNSAPSVVAKLPVIFLCGSADHILPTCNSGSFGHAVGHQCAPTVCACTRTEIISANKGDSTTLAPALPDVKRVSVRLAGYFPSEADNSPSAKSKPGQILKSVARRNGTWNNLGRVNVFAHIDLSGGCSFQWAAPTSRYAIEKMSQS